MDSDILTFTVVHRSITCDDKRVLHGRCIDEENSSFLLLYTFLYSKSSREFYDFIPILIALVIEDHDLVTLMRIIALIKRDYVNEF